MTMALEDLSVLVVDDNAQAVKLLSLVLEGIGVGRILTAKDGRMAQELLNAEHEVIDLVICDGHMPDMPGLELLKTTRKSHPNLPFIMVTGNADPKFVAATEKLGISGFVQKPFAPQQIEEMIRALVQEL